MKDPKKCLRCGSHRIAGPHRATHHVPSPIRLMLRKFKGPPLNFFTCADYGYTETYVDSKGLEDITTNGFFSDETIEK